MRIHHWVERALRAPFGRGATILLLLACTLLLPNLGFLLRGESLVFTDNYNPIDDRSHGPDAFPEELWTKRGVNPSSSFHDPGAEWWQWEPGGEFLRRAIGRGEWPWWDPYVAAGAPAMANLTQAFFFPPYLLLVLLGNGAVLKNLYFLLLVLQAGAFSYLLLRRNGLSAAAAFGGAAGVMMCGGLNRNVGSFIGQTSACLPFLLWITHWALGRASLRACGVLAGGYAMVALASFPPMLVANFACVGIYAVLQILHVDPALRARKLGAFVMSATLGLGLVAFYYTPAFIAIESARHVKAFYEGAGRSAEPWGTLWGLMSPVAAPAAVFDDPPFEDEIGPNTMPFVGLAVLLLALAGVKRWSGPPGVLWWSMCVTSVLFFLKFVGVEPVNQLAKLPGLARIHFSYFDITISTLLPLLAAFGVERIRNCDLRRPAIGLLVLAGGVGLFSLFRRAVGHGLMEHPLRGEWIPYWNLMLSVWVTLSLILVAMGRDPKATRARFAMWAAVLLIVAEGTYNNRFPHQHIWDVWRHPPPVVAALADLVGQDRTYSDPNFPPNLGSAFEIPQLESIMTINPPRIYQLYVRYAMPHHAMFMFASSEIPPEPVLDAANIRIVNIGVGNEQLAEARGYRLVHDDGRMKTWQRNCEPRHYFSTRYQVAGSASLEALSGRKPGEVVLESDPHLPDGTQGLMLPVELVNWGRNGYTLRVRAPGPGLVYSSESYFSGWTARVNGLPTEILPANHAFRAVVVPGGESIVEYDYWPPGLTAGLTVSALSTLAWLALLFGSWRSRRTA